MHSSENYWGVEIQLPRHLQLLLHEDRLSCIVRLHQHERTHH
ncbi:hypothetical protein SeD_A0633 [Salmonella enterica subsp. enterica serovar Dublin str. CT_02021853]|uniref:Uncharacterized protein n=2 Tax=Salmonella dublin TaxID=98360 RepID=A0A8X6JXE9_SALDU|nr:hypothetical protein SeD_A0633 [Salmonella enterica subsp. enterica serovar Dublin str. CT_02021853]EGE28633.1 hypothetical protein SD3246_0620 [Salmonella enterica subsp. enterica serovar Dublin str. SD3246]